MRKTITLLSVLVLLLGTACNNDAKTDAAAKDTATGKDTLTVDPKNFSDPH